MNLKNKKILITAGPTWVPIDDVRVISNIATGETGILLAEKFQQFGAKVTLVLGPVASCCLSSKIKLIHFKFFDELFKIIKSELGSKKYDLVIHSAAVADFKPKQVTKGKIASGQARNLRLIPLPKIIREIRRLASGAMLVMFKLECGVFGETLRKRARIAQRKIGADFVVANSTHPYRAFLIDRVGNKVFTANNKIDLVKKLSRTLGSEP